MIKAFKKTKILYIHISQMYVSLDLNILTYQAKKIWYRELKLHKVDLTSQSIPMVESLMISMIKNR